MSFTAVVETRGVFYRLSNTVYSSLIPSHKSSERGMEPGAWDPVGASSGHAVRRPQAPAPLPATYTSYRAQPPHSSPLPQRSWSDLPVEFHPGESSRASPTPPTAGRPSVPTKDMTSWSDARFGVQTSPRRRQRRPESLTNLPPASQLLHPDPNLLMPHASPYDPPHTARSAPEQLQRITTRPISQPGFSDDFDYLEPGRSDYGPGLLPRSPTYPPGSSGSNRSRLRSGSHGNDHAFQDEEEFHLFTEAMTGLGPIPTFRQSSIVEMPRAALAPPTEQFPQMSHRAEPPRGFEVSPIEETPTTVQAYTNLASMPSNSNLRDPPMARSRARDADTPPIDISDSGLDLWEPQPPTEPFPEHDDVQPPDDELPDYASSQAQAHAAQRVEATRRAQELQRQWKASGRRYGSHG